MTTPTDLYRAYDGDGRLLYVGISLNAFSRLVEHKRDSGWVEQMVTMTVERFPTREIAEWEERKAIKEHRPIWNRMHNSDKPLAPRPINSVVTLIRWRDAPIHADVVEAERLTELKETA
jgi:excinuclease UvrABC nuclease subunit